MNEQSEETQKASRYEFAPSGIVSRDGVPVAFVQDGKVQFLGDGTKYRAWIARFLKGNGVEADIVETVEEPIADAAPAGIAAPVDPQPIKVEVVPVTSTKIGGVPFGVVTLKEQFPGYPGEIDPAAGDKTPAFVDWLSKNHPAIAAQRYRGRQFA